MRCDVAQVEYDHSRTAYTSAVAAVKAWQARFLESKRSGTPDSASSAMRPAHAPATAAGLAKSKRPRRGKSLEDDCSSEAVCPVRIPPIEPPIPAAVPHTVESIKALAAAASQPWATPAARFEVAAAALALPAAAFTPPPRAPLDAPPPTPPPEPLPTDGYLWSALGKTAYLVDGLELSPTKLADLEALAKERAAAAADAPEPLAAAAS